MSMITLALQRAGLKNVLEGVSGITTVYAYMPGAIPDGKLPAIVLMPGNADYSQEGLGGDEILVMRQWTARIVGQTSGLGDPTDTEKSMDTILDGTIERLAAYKRIEVTEIPDINRVFDVFLTGGGDTGLSVITVGDKDYAGSDVTFFTQVEGIITPAYI